MNHHNVLQIGNSIVSEIVAVCMLKFYDNESEFREYFIA